MPTFIATPTQSLKASLGCAAAAVFALLPALTSAQQNDVPLTATVRVLVTPGRSLNRFDPTKALGAGIDGHNEGETARQLSSDNISAMRSAGLKPLAYRLRTELANEAWHWNSRGRWSDASHHQGYWTSDSRLQQPIAVSYGYRLPRRGNTVDQANNDGYSRLDDGDRATFWKSNPYLDEHYSPDNKSLPPQWIIIDLGATRRVNAIKIDWGAPFARHYRVEYGQPGVDEDDNQPPPAIWHVFSNGIATSTDGAERLLRLAEQSIDVRFIRIMLSNSSHTATAPTRDIRDRLGFAVRELHVGAVDQQGHFTDWIQHGAAVDRQTRIYVSSTDPWHRASDRDKDTEQPGFDFVFRSGLTHQLPMLVPVPLLYDTPENAVAELHYLVARGYHFDQIELGEEPDGQWIDAEHYGALYRLYYRRLHRIRSSLQFGGPSMQDIEPSPLPNDTTLSKASWLGRFLDDMQGHDSLKQFSFFSFEWYPFSNDCNAAKQLRDAVQILTTQLQALQDAGLTHRIPWIMSEYGYSAYGTRSEVDIDGALLNADSVARFLSLGGTAAYLYGYEPSDIINEQRCSAGNNMLFFRDAAGHITERTAAYWGARLLTQEWVAPAAGMHDLYATQIETPNSDDSPPLSGYALHRPDDLWSLLLINKDPQHRYRIHLEFQDTNTQDIASFFGPVDRWQYSREQYQLNSDAFNPYPIRAEPPSHTRSDRSAADELILPPYSITIVRGSISGMPTRPP